MRVLQCYPFMGTDKGGIVSMLNSFLPALKQCGVGTELLTQSMSGQRVRDSPLNELIIEAVVTADPVGFAYSWHLIPGLKRHSLEADIIHCHGLWLYMNFAAYRVARQQKKPFVVTIHGMLEPYIVEKNRWKKWPIEHLFQNHSLQNATCLHAICQAEVDSIRRQGFTTPIALLPNGINLKEFETLPSNDRFQQRFPAMQNRKILLFMARLHPKKGLVPLVGAWSELADVFPDWQLVIAGADEGGHLGEIERVVEEAKIKDRVTFTGLLTGETKLEALAAAEAFVLPSFSEGFSMGIIEAMACRLPVILTPNCNFPEAVAAGAAVSADPNASSLVTTIYSLLILSDDERHVMGQKGRDVIEKDYTWEKIARRFEAVYYWCIKGGEKPSTLSTV